MVFSVTLSSKLRFMQIGFRTVVGAQQLWEKSLTRCIMSSSVEICGYKKFDTGNSRKRTRDIAEESRDEYTEICRERA